MNLTLVVRSGEWKRGEDLLAGDSPDLSVEIDEFRALMLGVRVPVAAETSARLCSSFMSMSSLISDSRSLAFIVAFEVLLSGVLRSLIFPCDFLMLFGVFVHASRVSSLSSVFI